MVTLPLYKLNGVALLTISYQYQVFLKHVEDLRILDIDISLHLPIICEIVILKSETISPLFETRLRQGTP